MEIFILHHRENHGSIGQPAALQAGRKPSLAPLRFPAQVSPWRRLRKQGAKAVFVVAVLGFFGGQLLGCATQPSPAVVLDDGANPPAALPKEGYVSKKTISLASGRQEALRALSGLTVFVAPLSKATERLGLNRDQIKVDVEYQLRKAGLKVLTEPESFKTQEKAYLYINLSTISLEGVCSYLIQVQIMEMVKLTRGAITVGSVWNTNLLGVVGIANIETIRVRVGELIEEFIKAFPPLPIGDQFLEGVKAKPRPRQ